MRNVAVVLAAGSGRRMGEGEPKQFLPLAGRTVLEHTLGAFEAAPSIEAVWVVVEHASIRRAQDLAAPFGKVAAVVGGGPERSDSSRLAIAALAASVDEDCNVLFHDAARPLVRTDTIEACVAALGRARAVTTAIESEDTVMEADGDTIVRAPERERLRRVQTPQGFRLSVIRRAYEAARADPSFAATDDCGVVLRYLPDEPILVVAGSRSNVKITRPEDLAIAERLLELGAPD